MKGTVLGVWFHGVHYLEVFLYEKSHCLAGFVCSLESRSGILTMVISICNTESVCCREE